MYKVNDVANWLSQTTDNSKYFVWSPGLWDKESRLYLEYKGDKKWLSLIKQSLSQKYFFAMKLCAKYQKASVQALVQVDFPVYALSKHK